jgi:hypothetical protein
LLRGILQWKSECNGGEVESKNGFEEHHSALGRSKKLRFTEGCREVEGEPGQRRAERDTALYSRDPRGPFQEEREVGVFFNETNSRVPLVCQSGS